MARGENKNHHRLSEEELFGSPGKPIRKGVYLSKQAIYELQKYGRVLD